MFPGKAVWNTFDTSSGDSAGNESSTEAGIVKACALTGAMHVNETGRNRG